MYKNHVPCQQEAHRLAEFVVYVFKHIIWRVNREVLASQKEQSLSKGGMWGDFIKDNELVECSSGT